MVVDWMVRVERVVPGSLQILVHIPDSWMGNLDGDLVVAVVGDRTSVIVGFLASRQALALCVVSASSYLGLAFVAVPFHVFSYLHTGGCYLLLSVDVAAVVKACCSTCADLVGAAHAQAQVAACPVTQTRTAAVAVVVVAVGYTVLGDLAAAVSAFVVVNVFSPFHSFAATHAHGQTLRTWVCVDPRCQVSVALVLHADYPWTVCPLCPYSSVAAVVVVPD